MMKTSKFKKSLKGMIHAPDYLPLGKLSNGEENESLK